jgi:hypothetical protein
MDSVLDRGGSTSPAPISRHVVGPPGLRLYGDYNLVAWQPRGVLDDVMLDQIVEWLTPIERVFLSFNRFIDFSQLTSVAIRTDHVFEFAQKRAAQFAGHPVRTGLFCEDWVGFGVARLYESVMENTPIRARAFRDRSLAAEWLDVPPDVLFLKDEPGPLDLVGKPFKAKKDTGQQPHQK